MDYITIFGRSLFFYVLIVFLYRIMGKREVGELSIMDLIVSFFIAQLASISIENFDKPILRSLIPIGILVSLQVLSSIIELKSAKAKDVIDGNISVIINKGKVNFLEMSKQRYNLDDLLSQLREQGIKSLEEVDYAVLETSGKLSIFKLQDDTTRTYPLPVIVDGKLQKDTLTQIGKSINWLKKELMQEKCSIEDIFYAFYKNKNLFIIKRENIK